MEDPVDGQSKASEERREVHRHGADLAVRFSLTSGETGRKSKEIPGAVKNLSESGFCLTTDLTVIDDLHVLSSSSGISENILKFHIQLPEDEAIDVEGVACWYNLSDPGENYRYAVGIRILSISEDHLTCLRKFLRQERKERIFKGLLKIKWLERLLRGF